MAQRPGSSKPMSVPKKSSPATPLGERGGRGHSGATARARLAAEQARQERRRRRLFGVAIPVAVVLVAVGALVVVRLAGGGTTTTAASAGPANDTVVSAVTSVPAGILDQVGVGSNTSLPQAVTAHALTDGRKPKVLYVGAEYCPYCAAERWPVAVALSRFGTFTNLGQTTSAAQDIYPNTPTLTFHGSTYTSNTIAFTGTEIQSNEIASGTYAPLDTLSPADQQTFTTYNQPPYLSSSGSIPFVDIGGKYLISGSYNPQLLQGKTHEQSPPPSPTPTPPSPRPSTAPRTP